MSKRHSHSTEMNIPNEMQTAAAAFRSFFVIAFISAQRTERTNERKQNSINKHANRLNGMCLGDRSFFVAQKLTHIQSAYAADFCEEFISLVTFYVICRSIDLLLLCLLLLLVMLTE